MSAQQLAVAFCFSPYDPLSPSPMISTEEWILQGADMDGGLKIPRGSAPSVCDCLGPSVRKITQTNDCHHNPSPLATTFENYCWLISFAQKFIN